MLPNQTYTMKMAIADVSDALWDSYVLLKQQSLEEPATSALSLDLISFDLSLENKQVLLLEYNK